MTNIEALQKAKDEAWSKYSPLYDKCAAARKAYDEADEALKGALLLDKARRRVWREIMEATKEMSGQTEQTNKAA